MLIQMVDYNQSNLSLNYPINFEIIYNQSLILIKLILIRKLKEPLQISLLGKEELATDTYVYRFQLPDLSSTLGHSTCQYLEFEAEILNRETKQKEKYLRYYHPMSKVIDSGYVDLLIKVYLRNFKHPTGGLFTQYMDQIQEGSVLKITGIGGDIQYDGYSNFLIRNQSTKLMEKKTYKNVGMIAGGSGITPMFQLVQTVADLKNDFTSLSLIYSNRTPVSFVQDLYLQQCFVVHNLADIQVIFLILLPIHCYS